MSDGEVLPETDPDAIPGGPLLAFGFLIALVCSMCGVGGGLFTVPLLHFGYKMELRRAVATALGLVVATVTAATVTEALHEDSALELRLIAVLVVGALAGAQVGFEVAKRVEVRLLRIVFVLALLVAGARILLGSAHAPVPADALVLDLASYATALAIGFGGGFSAPLLGIGGGLVFVPALYLALPELGFPGARAMSLATSVAASSRSLWLYLRARQVVPRSALWLAAGAVVGAFAGVRLVHLPGVVEIARIALGVILWYVGARFALQAFRERAGSRAAV